jgi:hypothetical protein
MSRVSLVTCQASQGKDPYDEAWTEELANSLLANLIGADPTGFVSVYLQVAD